VTSRKIPAHSSLEADSADRLGSLQKRVNGLNTLQRWWCLERISRRRTASRHRLISSQVPCSSGCQRSCNLFLVLLICRTCTLGRSPWPSSCSGDRQGCFPAWGHGVRYLTSAWISWRIGASVRRTWPQAWWGHPLQKLVRTVSHCELIQSLYIRLCPSLLGSLTKSSPWPSVYLDVMIVPGDTWTLARETRLAMVLPPRW